MSTRMGLYRFKSIKPGASNLVQKLHIMLQEISAMVGEFSTRKDVEPIHGFAAETSSSLVIMSPSFFGAPISTTHAISSAIPASAIVGVFCFTILNLFL